MALERLGSFAKSPADIAEVEGSIAQCHLRASAPNTGILGLELEFPKRQI